MRTALAILLIAGGTLLAALGGDPTPRGVEIARATLAEPLARYEYHPAPPYLPRRGAVVLPGGGYLLPPGSGGRPVLGGLERILILRLGALAVLLLLLARFAPAAGLRRGEAFLAALLAAVLLGAPFLRVGPDGIGSASRLAEAWAAYGRDAPWAVAAPVPAHAVPGRVGADGRFWRLYPSTARDLAHVDAVRLRGKLLRLASPAEIRPRTAAALVLFFALPLLLLRSASLSYPVRGRIPRPTYETLV